MAFLTGCNILPLTQNFFKLFVNQVRNKKKLKFEIPIFISDNTKYDSACNRASYFCESDYKNNFSIRREPSFFREAVAICRNESSFLTSSKSVSEINYAKKGFADVSIDLDRVT